MSVDEGKPKRVVSVPLRNGGDMPRPNRGRVVRAERNVADRIAFERQQRGWTLEGLAKRMSDAGCPINSSAIYKIESGDPPRRVTVDELVALSMVFETDVADLLIPIALVNNKRARKLYGDVDASFDDVARGAGRLLNALLAYLDVVEHEPELRRLVDELWFGGETGGGSQSESASVGQILRADGGVISDDVPGVQDALVSFVMAMIDVADQTWELVHEDKKTQSGRGPRG